MTLTESDLCNRYSGHQIKLHKLSDDITVTNRWEKGFEAAKAAALCSPVWDKRPKAKLGAVIYSGSRLLAAGYNQQGKTSPGSVVTTPVKQFSLNVHAEHSAILKIRYRADNFKSKLICYVVRLNTVGGFATSKPCNECIRKLREAGVGIVRFHNQLGQPEEIHI